MTSKANMSCVGLAAGAMAFVVSTSGTLAQRAAPLEKVEPVPQQFVVSPKDGQRIHDHITINADTAERLAKICEDNVKKRGGSITVVVMSPYGQIIHMHAMDGQSYINIQATLAKTKTALLTRAPSHVLTNRSFDDVQVTIRMDQFGLNVQEGGLPIIVNDQLIGAIGAGGGGAPGYSEEQCAQDALTEVFGPQPPLLPQLGAGGNGGIPARAPNAAGGRGAGGGRGGAAQGGGG